MTEQGSMAPETALLHAYAQAGAYQEKP